VRAPKAARPSEPAPIHAAANSADEAPPDGADLPVRLPEVLDLAAAAPLARDLLGRRGRPTIVDAVGIERPGASCLQVLLAAIRTWEADGLPLAFANCGPRLIEHLRFLGVDPAAFLKEVQS
jgi:chemotaxis protein CheX